MESLNILTFLRYPPWDKRAAGGQFSAWSTITGLAERGHKLKVIIGDTQEKLPYIKGIEFFKTKSYKINITNIDWFFESLNFSNIDLIYGFDPENFLTNIYWKKFKKVPIIHEVHSPRVLMIDLKSLLMSRSLEALKWQIYFELDKFASQNSTAVITPSNFMKVDLEKKYKLKQNRMKVVYNGVNSFNNERKRKFFENGTELLFIGALIFQKGVDILLDCFHKICSKFNNVNLNIVGSGLQEDKLKKHVLKLGLMNRVTFFGRLPEFEKNNLLINSDILIVPSRHENFPMVILEAMSAGLPVIGTDVGGIPEQIMNGVNGVIVKPTVDSLYEAIKDLITHQYIAEKMGTEGKKSFQKYFTKEKMIRDKMNIINELI